MNLLTDSLCNCCTAVQAQVCDMPQRLVLTVDQDLRVQPCHSLLEDGAVSVALPAQCTKLAVLGLLNQLLGMLMTSLELKLNGRRRPTGPVRS